VFYYEVTILNPSWEHLNLPSQQVHPTAPLLEPLVASYDMMSLDTHDSFSISNHLSHTRIGFASSSLDVEMPVGTDLSSYSYRDHNGAVFNDGATPMLSLMVTPTQVLTTSLALSYPSDLRNPSSRASNSHSESGLPLLSVRTVKSTSSKTE
jgi:hypothetical protein